MSDSDSQLNLSKFLIVIADDSESITKMLNKIVKEFGGTDVVTFNSGRRCFQYLKNSFLENKKPILALVDWNMPDFQGITILKEIRQIPGNELCKFVMVSSESEASYIKEAFESGATGYILKPFSMQILKKELLKLTA